MPPAIWSCSAASSSLPFGDGMRLSLIFGFSLITLLPLTKTGYLDPVLVSCFLAFALDTVNAQEGVKGAAGNFLLFGRLQFFVLAVGFRIVAHSESPFDSCHLQSVRWIGQCYRRTILNRKTMCKRHLVPVTIALAVR